jgi:TPR repeat protein
MYEHGYGVPTNILTAIEWYTKAANQGHGRASYRLREFYRTKKDLKDLQKAVNWYQKSVDNGDSLGQYDLKELNKQGYYAKEKHKGNDYLYLPIIYLKQLLKSSRI